MTKKYLKPGDIVIADSVILVYDGTKYVLASDGLSAASKFMLDKKTEQEYPIKYEVSKDGIRPFFILPE